MREGRFGLEIRNTHTSRWREDDRPDHRGEWYEDVRHWREVYLPGYRYAIPVGSDPEPAIREMVERFEAELRTALG